MGDNKFNFLIVDDHKLFGEALARLVSSFDFAHIIGIVASGQEAIDLLSKNHVDLMITDIRMPGIDGLELIRKVKHHFHYVKILVISMHGDISTAEQIFKANAEGFILKDSDLNEFQKAISRILDNGTYYSNILLENLLRRSKHNLQNAQNISLSERETEILELIMQDYSSEEIANKLFISKRTVDTHRKNILQKTNCKTLVSLIKFAYENGIGIKKDNNFT